MDPNIERPDRTPRTTSLLGTILDRDGILCAKNAPSEWVELCRELEAPTTPEPTDPLANHPELFKP